MLMDFFVREGKKGSILFVELSKQFGCIKNIRKLPILLNLNAQKQAKNGVAGTGVLLRISLTWSAY